MEKQINAIFDTLGGLKDDPTWEAHWRALWLQRMVREVHDSDGATKAELKDRYTWREDGFVRNLERFPRSRDVV